MPPPPVVANHDLLDDEQEYPVCLEPFGFSFRSPGEKAHVAPECGRSFHEACFTSVHGHPPPQSRSSVPPDANLEVCSVCHRSMKVGDGNNNKTNKLTVLTDIIDSGRNALCILAPLAPDPFSVRNTSAQKDNEPQHLFPSTSEQQPPHYPSPNGWVTAYNAIGTEPSLNAPPQPCEDDSPFSTIVEDLRNRIIDWKGHALSDLGPLQMYDLLSVRRKALVREFFVYLFKEAIICVVEEKKSTFDRFLPSPTFNDSTAVSGSIVQCRDVLRLKGRIYVRHIRQITAGIPSDLSLTIEVEDERLNSFILVFKDRSSLKAWRSQIQSLVTSFKQRKTTQSRPAFGRGLNIEKFGAPEKARVLSGRTVGSLLQASNCSTLSSATSIILVVMTMMASAAMFVVYLVRS